MDELDAAWAKLMRLGETLAIGAHNGSAGRQQHAIADRARAVAPEELDPGDQLGAHRDNPGKAREASAQRFEPLP